MRVDFKIICRISMAKSSADNFDFAHSMRLQAIRSKLVEVTSKHVRHFNNVIDYIYQYYYLHLRAFLLLIIFDAIINSIINHFKFTVLFI